MSREDFLLKWNDHHDLFFAGAELLCQNEEFTDVTLAAGKKFYPAHKLVLSICSPYFQNLFRRLGQEKHVIFLKDVSSKHLELLLQYMYKGEIKVQEDELVTVLNTAQSLEIKGLTDSTESSGSGAPARPPDPPSKRSSPSPARRPAPTQSYTPAPALADDDIQEVTPVKVEPAVVAGEVAVRPGYSEGSGVAHNQVQPVADTSLQYIEQYQEDYGEYEEEEYYQAGEMQETDRTEQLISVESVGKGDLVCPYCHKKYSSPSGLRQHLPVHTKATSWNCDGCALNFLFPPSFRC